MFLKTLLTTCGLLSLCLTAAEMPRLDFDPPPRRIKMDQKKITILNGKNFEIVVPDDAGKPAKFAGKEMQSFLNQVLSAKIPLRNTRSKNAAHAIILGDSALSRKAGIKIDDLGRDAFFMKTIGKDIYIVGRDDKASDTEKLLNDRSWKTQPFLHHRATLFGAYDFLERFADVRFYFNGPIGTIVPQKSSLKIPALNIFDRPDNIVRFFMERRYDKKTWYLNENPIRGTNLLSLRLRTQTRNIPNCHGLACLGHVTRFGKSNPEFFALKKDGTRYNTFDTDFAGQLCLSNAGLRDEIFKDILSGLRGEPHTVRGITSSSRRYPQGIPHWSCNTLLYPGFFNVHLQDACQPCLCKDCQKAYYPDKSGKISGELIWDMTADMARRVKKAGLKAYITQMAYHFYKEVPKLDLPDNVLVQVALPGPWAQKSAALDKYDRDLLAAWHKKLGKKVWLWSYVANSATPGTSSTPGAPQYSPKAFARYYQARKDDICGAFMMNSMNSDYIHDAMNMYVGTKVLWNTSLNVDQLMAEYYNKMFHAAAPEMKKFFEELEYIWTTKVRGQFVETELGPVALKPTEFETWERIYTQKKLAEWQKLFNKAEKKVAKDKNALARVRFMKKHFLATMQKHSKAFQARASRSNHLVAYAAPAGKERSYILSRMHGQKTLVKAGVKIQNTGKELVFHFRAEEPKMDALKFNPRKGDLKEFFESATFEIFLNPSCDRKTIYQVAISPAGTICPIQHYPRVKWGKEIKTKTFIGKDHWTAEVRIPLSILPDMNRNGFPANFSYNRQLKNTVSCSELYSWSPWLRRGFLEVDNYGQLSLNVPKLNNLVSDFDFDGLKRKGNKAAKWRIYQPRQKNGDIMDLSSEYFISGGQSAKCVGTTAKSRISFDQPIPGKLKSNTKYRFSYYVRYDLDNNAKMYNTVYAGRNFFVPERGIKGKQDWTMVTGEFTTKQLTKDHIGKFACISFVLHGKGTAYIDHIVLQEVKK